jgi:hypothetical protein
MMADNESESMLTTIDNPWNPHTNYAEWLAWDREHGYDTNGYLARVANVSLDLPEDEVDQSIGQAIDEIVQLNPNGKYTKAYRPAA